MRFTISGKNIDVTESMRRSVMEKLGKLERYFTEDTQVIVTMSVEKDRQKIEVTIPMRGTVIRSEQVSNDMYVSIDLVEEVIERQLRGMEASEGSLLRRRQSRSRRSGLPVQRSLISNRCIRRMPVFRWSCSDTASTFSAMRRQTKPMLFTNARAGHMV